MHALAAEQPLHRIPGEEDDDPELDALPGRLVVEPVLLVRAGDVSRLADALRADDDVSVRRKSMSGNAPSSPR